MTGQKDFDIVGIGAALVDRLVRCNDAWLAAHGLEKGRMHLIDAERAAALETDHASAQLVSGGSAANTCLGLASFGGRAGFIGGVGADALGQLFANDLERSGVTFHNIAGATDVVTGFCSCYVTPDGERTMATYLGASANFAPDAPVEDLAAQTRLLYVEGYIWDTPARVAVADRAIRAAHAAGAKIALTISDAWCADAYRDHFLRYCAAGLVDILFANEAEIVALTQAADFNMAVAQARTLVATGVFTRGAAGTIIQQGERLLEVAAEPVAQVVDTTGAGDLFAAGFLYGYLQGVPLADAGRYGALAAAEVIAHPGARPQVALASLL